MDEETGTQRLRNLHRRQMATGRNFTEWLATWRPPPRTMRMQPAHFCDWARKVVIRGPLPEPSSACMVFQSQRRPLRMTLWRLLQNPTRPAGAKAKPSRDRVSQLVCKATFTQPATGSPCRPVTTRQRCNLGFGSAALGSRANSSENQVLIFFQFQLGY